MTGVVERGRHPLAAAQRCDRRRDLRQPDQTGPLKRPQRRPRRHLPLGRVVRVREGELKILVQAGDGIQGEALV
jgi:hypothetical protein